MTLTVVLNDFKEMLEKKKKIDNEYSWLSKLKSAYYRDYSQKVYHNNIVNWVSAWIALIAIVAAALIVVFCTTIAMPGVAILGIALGVGIAAAIGIGFFARIRWNAYSSMMNLQDSFDKNTKLIMESDSNKVAGLHYYLDRGQRVVKSHCTVLSSVCDIVGVKLPEKSPEKKGMSSSDFKPDQPLHPPTANCSYSSSDAYLFNPKNRPTKSMLGTHI